MSRARTIRHAVLLAALAAGCATLEPPQEEALPVGAWELVTSSFVESGRLPGMPRPTLEVTDGRLSAYSGCNRGSGAVHVSEGRLAIDALEVTRRECPEPIGSFDARFFRLLKDRPVYQVSRGALLLVAGDENARFRRR
jgi:heat shock protein HslJ